MAKAGERLGADLDRRELLRWLGTGALALAMPGLPLAAAEREGKPNLVLILADDLGYGELGVQGGRDLPTPHIDSIAQAGVRFTQGYVSCPVCAPTRAGLMTGRYQQRFGLETNPGPQAPADYGLPLDQVTIAERLKSLGYATGMVGKWHLGNRTELSPPRRGFDEFFGFLGGSDSYYPPRPGAILRGTEVAEEQGYLTEAFAREAVAFIGKHAREPFFLYLAPNAVHMPLQAPDRYLSRFAGIQDPTRRTFAAMLAALDDAVGQVLAALREHQLERNTLLVFLSDNGGPTAKTTSGNGPLRGFKAQVLEGGIRIPFMMQWPGHLAAGQVYRQPVTSLDLHATLTTAAGATIRPEWGLDGVDLLPFLHGERTAAPHPALFWRIRDQWAIRQGDWKLLSLPAGTPELYHLSEDVGEAHNLAGDMPDRVKELTAAWQAWSSQLQAPRWSAARRTRPRRRRQAV